MEIYEKNFIAAIQLLRPTPALEAGLAYHTATMVRLAECQYPQLVDLTLLWGLCYDLAKVIELTGRKIQNMFGQPPSRPHCTDR